MEKDQQVQNTFLDRTETNEIKVMSVKGTLNDQFVAAIVITISGCVQHARLWDLGIWGIFILHVQLLLERDSECDFKAVPLWEHKLEILA